MNRPIINFAYDYIDKNCGLNHLKNSVKKFNKGRHLRKALTPYLLALYAPLRRSIN